MQNGVAKPVKVSIEGTNAELVMNPATADLGNLAGRNERKYNWSPWGQQWSQVSKQVEWLVRATGKDASVTVTTASEKGGTHRRTAKLSA